MTDKAERKKLQREKGISARKSLDSETSQRFSRMIAEKLISEPAYTNAKIILSYKAFAGEVDTAAFNEAALRVDKLLAFPICYSGGIMVAAVPYTSADWETGKYGIKAPVESRSRILNPEDIDLVIVPCTAFDGRNRMRIGWGAGYYDRFLIQCKKAVSIAIAFEGQKVDDLCCDKWDVPLDAVITEENRY